MLPWRAWDLGGERASAMPLKSRLALHRVESPNLGVIKAAFECTRLATSQRQGLASRQLRIRRHQCTNPENH